MSHRKDLHTVFKDLQKQGFTVEKRRSGHVAITSPSGERYFTGSSPSDWRAIKHLQQDLTKFGYRKPVKKRKKKRGDPHNT